MSKTYAITLKLVGEARLVGVHGPADDTLDVASIRKDFGKIGETICNASDLDTMRPVKSVMIGSIDGCLPELMIQMLHLARDMDMGKFRGQAFAEAVQDGVLCGGSLRGDVSREVLRQFDEMGLTTLSPLVPWSRIN